MKLVLLMTGKTDEPWLREGIAGYEKRIARYSRFESIILPDVKNTASMPAEKIKEKEGERILGALKADDYVVLLDEHGKAYTTLEMASFLSSSGMIAKKRVVFVIGGAWGFHESVRARADHKLSLSKLTFSHQLVRLLFAEQLYRVLSVIAGDPYHHE
ncbi:MAG TPA: 23S rRNA (pseudouridine(1915)-N(3))-methyltransferase RlmH [Bacteroidales bacterium]|nr:23S rRNA (pseudouridine(1915)-N(3))-methyltransferase RlmH [Bacteroidales bacterium]